MRVRIDTFGALSVRPMEDIAGATRATRARDVDLRRGKLHPLASPTIETDFSPTAAAKTIHYFPCGQGEWRVWAGHVPVARGPADPWDRTAAARWYYAEGGTLKVLACVGGGLVERDVALAAPTGTPTVGVRPAFAPPALTLYYDGQSSFDPDELTSDDAQTRAAAYKFTRQSVTCPLSGMEVDGNIVTLRYRRPGVLRALNMRVVGGFYKADIPPANFGYVLKYAAPSCSTNAADPFERDGGGALVDSSRPNPAPESLEMAAVAPVTGTVGTLYPAEPREIGIDRSFRPELPEGYALPGDVPDELAEGAIVVSGAGWISPATLEFRCRVSWAQPRAREWRYRFAYVDDIGQLSPGGPASATVRVPPGHVPVCANWDAASVGVPGTVDAAEVRLYRAGWDGVTEAKKAQWWRLGARYGSGGTYDPPTLADWVSGAGAYCDTTTGRLVYGGFWDLRGDDGFDTARDLAPEEGPPPAGISALVAHPGGFLVAIAARSDADGEAAAPVLRFSEVRHANHWPPDFSAVTVDAPVALEVAGNDLVVATNGRPEVFFGSVPQRLTGSRLAFDQPCISARGLCAVGGLVCYPSPDGLCGIAGGAARVLTAGHILPDQWKALALADVPACDWEGRWLSGVSLTSGEGVVVDPGSGDTVTHTVAATAFHYEPLTDGLWCVWAAEPLYSGGNDRWVAGIFGDGEAREFLWRSALFLRPERAHWTALRVRAQAYPVYATLLFHRRRVWAADDLDGDALDTAARAPLKIMDGRAFRLPATVPPLDAWAIEIRASAAVMEAAVGTSPAELEG